ncbi:hypothetical protein H5410_012085 [Solanum commersonii]|uniref:Uncharacterized protein n=1 Tax=Solanum commersonii TaxID=4109 RepID=A0A9J6ARF4_SOLCO|nr:hypothetical protein H5410_012085 [Solanum commersonii]
MGPSSRNLGRQGWKKVLKRHKGIGESFSAKKNKCSLCKRIGHKRTTCSEMLHKNTFVLLRILAIAI